MAAVGRIKLKVHLNDDEKVSEVFVSPTTKCRDIVLRLQRQIRQQDCCLVEVWQGCERLVPEDELIQSTLLEWDTDLDDVAFYLRPNEDMLTIMPQSGLTNEIPMLEDIEATYGDQSILVTNGSHDDSMHSSLSDELLLGNGQISIEDLQQIILRQQQQISLKEEELSTKEEQLYDVKQRAQSRIRSSYISELEAQSQEQDESMRQLRHLLNDTEEIKMINEALVEELDQIEAQFASKEQELVMAVAKVDGMTQQLEEQRQGWRNASTAREQKPSNQQKEMDMLRHELMMRNELNHQQSIQLQVQKNMLAEKQRELSDLDAHVDKLTDELRYKKARGLEINKIHLNSSNNTLDFEDDMWDDDDTDGYDEEDVNLHSPSNSRHHNSRTLETLVEEEEPSVNNLSQSSASSSSGSNRTSPRVSSPGRASRVSRLATFFEVAAQTVEEGAGENDNNLLSKPVSPINHYDRRNDPINHVLGNTPHDSTIKGVPPLERLRPISVSQLDTHGPDSKAKASSPLSSPSSLSSLSSFSSNSSSAPSPAYNFFPERNQEDPRIDRPLKATPLERRSRLDKEDREASPEIRNFQSSLQNLKSAAMSLSDVNRPLNRMLPATSPQCADSTSVRIAKVAPMDIDKRSRDSNSSPDSSTSSSSSNSSQTLCSTSPKVYKSSATVSLGRSVQRDNGTLDSPITSKNNTNDMFYQERNDDSASESSVSSRSSLSEGSVEKVIPPREKPSASNIVSSMRSPNLVSQNKTVLTSENSNDLHKVSEKVKAFVISKKSSDSNSSSPLATTLASVDVKSELRSKEVSSASRLRGKEDESEKKKTRRVILDPHAVLLDAALEGELEQVRQVIKDVEDPSLANSDGITALHNAVCGNHFYIVQFLVEYGCDINLPDSHGWTPLHCSAVNNNLAVVRYMIEHGACIFAATNLERKTPADCCDKKAPGYIACSKYLQDIQRDFGLQNDGKVYALYAYTASEKDELSFDCGEELTVLRRGDTTEKEWWWAENTSEETGYIPRNLLGISPRVAPEV